MPDAVVVGAGPNGLVAANQLVDAGWSVVVLEAAPQAGGAVRSAELTLPGFRHDLFSAFYPLAAVSPIIRDLELEAYGLRWRHAPLVLAHPFPDGRCAAISTDLDESAHSVAEFARRDGDAWRRMIDAWDAIADPAMEFVLQPFPPARPSLTIARRLGAQGSLRLVRHLLLPVRRMAEELFEGEGARLLLGGSALHTDVTPEGAGSGAFGWLLCCLAQRHGYPVPLGGAGAITDALVARLESRGGEIRYGASVVEVIVRSGRAVGVRTGSGDVVDARRAVVADVTAPVLYNELVGAEQLPPSVLDDLSRFHWDVSTVKVDWALEGAIPWQAESAWRAGTVHVADDFDNLTEFAAEIAMGRLPARPFLLVGQQSLADPTRSPEGTDTAWAYTHVPTRIRADAAGELPVAEHLGGGFADEPWLDGFVERMESRVEALAPGFRERILARHVFSPTGMQGENASLVGGAIGGGTSQLHQQLMFRPIPGTGRSETPITGLYLASASAHPGGGVHGAGGANAARAALLPFARARAVAFGRATRRARESD